MGEFKPISTLYISYDGMTDPLGQSQVIPYLCGLSKAGYQIHLISCEKIEKYNQLKGTIEKILAENNIQWHPLLYHKSPPVLSTLFDIQAIKNKSVALHKKYSFQLVHCRSYISALCGQYLKNKFNIPFVFDMRGFWADERVDGGLWNLKNPIYKTVFDYFKKKEKAFFAESAAVVSLTHKGAEHIVDTFKIKKEKITVIPCSVDFNLFAPATKDEKNNWRKEYGINESSFVLSYLGSIGTWYMLDEMLDTFAALSVKYEKSVFLLLTPDAPETVYAKAKEKNIPPDKLIVRFAQKKEVRSLVGCSDLSLFYIKPSFSKIASSPTKLGELISMGIPVVCNAGVGDVEEIIQTCAAGICIPDFKKETLSEIPEKVNHLLAIYDANFSRQKGAEIYEMAKAVSNYRNIYSSILKK